MSPASCDEIDALLAVAALAGADSEERHAIDEHVRDCATCRAAAQRYLTVAGLLPLAVEAREPDPGLRQRIMTTVNAEAAGRRRSTTRRGWARWFQWLPAGRAYTAAGIVAATALTAIVIWSVGTRTDITHLRGAGTTDQPGAQADLFVDHTNKTAQLQVRGLRHPSSAGAVYEVWLIRGDKPQPAAYLQAQPDGSYSTTLSGDLSSGTLATTLEPQQGDPAPVGTEAFTINLGAA